ncbi:unnamed protein product [Clonostachys solani]|uniref:Uncharacterized protein n=1 Tax=Clonostachys solani TaxID=160281 RepID=A0A9N9Z087_9HYPO|nr:unnamed protein product [Clonostachys solani]
MAQDEENWGSLLPEVTARGYVELLRQHLNSCPAHELHNELISEIFKEIFDQTSKDLSLELAKVIVDRVRVVRADNLSFLNYEYLREIMDKAVEEDNVPLMEYLLSLSGRLEDGQMPSYRWSDRYNQKDIKQIGPRSASMMRVLVERGFDINQRPNSFTLLHFAVTSPYADDETVQLIKYLALNMLDIDQFDEHGYTPLHAWLQETQEDRWRGKKDLVWEITSHLLVNNASLATTAREENGDTPLHMVVRSVSPSLVKLFLERGANDRAENMSGKTPRDYAEPFRDSADPDEKEIFTLLHGEVRGS